jgi:hypothetical protein
MLRYVWEGGTLCVTKLSAETAATLTCARVSATVQGTRLMHGRRRCQHINAMNSIIVIIKSSSRDSVTTHRIFRQVSNAVLVPSHQRIASAIQKNNRVHALLPVQSRVTYCASRITRNVVGKSPANLAVQV